MTRAVISGYYGFNNLGDEAVLYSMLKIIKHQYPNFEPVVLSNAPEITGRQYNVESVNRWKVREVAGALRNADMLISGGGSLLQDVTGIKSIIYYTGVMWLARMLGKPVVFYSQGIGPVESFTGKKLVKREANRARLVTVRDEDSKQDLLDMGVKRDIKVLGDPVIGLDPGEVTVEDGLRILHREGLEKGACTIVGVSVRPWRGVTWKPLLAGALDRLVEKGLKVVFLPMHHPDDVYASEEVAEMMRHSCVIVRGNYSVPEMLSLVKNTDLLVGMRLHSLIFAALFGTYPVGISYDPKVERFLGRLGMTPAGSPEDLEEYVLLDHIEKGLSMTGEEILQKAAPLKEEARRGAGLIFE